MNKRALNCVNQLAMAYHNGLTSVSTERSNFSLELIFVLQRLGVLVNGYQLSFSRRLHIDLKANSQGARISFIFFSLPGKRVYITAKELKSMFAPGEMVVVSTSSGVLSLLEALSKNLGGELLFHFKIT